MNKVARIRWAILWTSLFLTVAAIFYPLNESELHLNAVQQKNVLMKNDVPVSVIGLGEIKNTDDDTIDPFAARGWKTIPEPPKALDAVSVSLAQVLAPLPSGPPPLPFRFLGKFEDGTDSFIYLGRGEQTFVVRLGDMVDGVYKILKITEQNVELEYVPTGDKQNLSFE